MTFLTRPSHQTGQPGYHRGEKNHACQKGWGGCCIVIYTTRPFSQQNNKLLKLLPNKLQNNENGRKLFLKIAKHRPSFFRYKKARKKLLIFSSASPLFPSSFSPSNHAHYTRKNKCSKKSRMSDHWPVLDQLTMKSCPFFYEGNFQQLPFLYLPAQIKFSNTNDGLQFILSTSVYS
jgi:hypothetical protein